jgi:hypothetical protein
MSNPNHRLYFRIRYPSEARPRLVLGSHICEVLDCSEKGVRFRATELLRAVPGERLEGKLRFPRGEQLVVRGSVVRIEEDRIALELSGRGVPFGVILQEQLYLRRAAH